MISPHWSYPHESHDVPASLFERRCRLPIHDRARMPNCNAMQAVCGYKRTLGFRFRGRRRPPKHLRRARHLQHGVGHDMIGIGRGHLHHRPGPRRTPCWSLYQPGRRQDGVRVRARSPLVQSELAPSAPEALCPTHSTADLRFLCQALSTLGPPAPQGGPLTRGRRVRGGPVWERATPDAVSIRSSPPAESVTCASLQGDDLVHSHDGVRHTGHVIGDEAHQHVGARREVVRELELAARGEHVHAY